MKKKITFCLFLLCIMACINISLVFATNAYIEPGSQYNITDFSNVSKGLYFDGTDFYYLLDTGVIATNYMYIQDGDRYYFGEDGKMVKDAIVDHDNEKYFFDPNGGMIKNRWVTEEELDPFDKTPTRTTYYFGPSGRAYKANEGSGLIVKTIDGERFGFNSDGHRLTGYVNLEGEELDVDTVYAYAECAYYFDPGENGAATTGWHEYSGPVDSGMYDDNNQVFLYFDEKTARKVYYRGNTAGGFLYRTIDGQRYMFDENGVRFCKWYSSPSNPTYSPKYYSDDYDGFLAKGWFLAVPPKDSITKKNRDRYSDDTEVWFYADSRGYLVRNCLKKIGRYTYCFDEDGVMQADALVVMKNGKYDRSYEVTDITREELIFGIDDGGLIGDNEFVLYFVDPENENLSGSMAKTDTKIKLELKDEDVSFFQSSRGGYSSEISGNVVLKNKKYYQHGVQLEAVNDAKYGIVKVNDNSYHVVNKVGSVVNKPGSYKMGADEFILVGPNKEYCGVYSVQCKYKDGVWSYLEDKKWIACPAGELPPETLRLSAYNYYVNFKSYNGEEAPEEPETEEDNSSDSDD